MHPRARVPLAVHHGSVWSRVMRDAVHPDHWKFEWSFVVDAAKPGLREICKALNETYRRALVTDRVGEEFLERGRGGDTTELTQEVGDAIRATAVDKQAVELIAEAILVVADGLLGSLNEALLRPVVISTIKKNAERKRAGKRPLEKARTAVNTAAGEPLAGGVAVEKLLDAFGNMPRHRGEWRYNREGAKTTLRVVARFLKDDRKLSSLGDAALAVYNEPEVGLKILDAIAGAGEGPDQPGVDPDALFATLLETGRRIIDKHWPEWLDVENERRAALRAEQEAAAAGRAQS
jgi:hypothetical protein